ncbi:MAG: polyprenyl synthetase family protein [Bacteroidales bacterium]|jgi:geranylgeranyl pyrophosphate synthase|nr:polyprenyl synthetase family protein [Bacteroidales bacterium]
MADILEHTLEKQIYTVPPTHEERDTLREQIMSFVKDRSLIPPLSMELLSGLSGLFIEEQALDPAMKGWIMVEINNCVWQETVASIPYEKRILLLPKCLSNSSKCRAEIDEFGLLCHRCNNCSIPNLQDEAEDLGMMSIVAEGFTSVVGLIESGAVDTVIGVGCLDSLEKAFPLLINNAVPGLAIPLNISGCKNTQVDDEYVSRMIHMQSGKKAKLLDYDHLKSNIKRWFSKGNLDAKLSPALDHTTSVAHEWMQGEGKRWRPYLLAATYMAMKGNENIPEEVQLAAIAVECFHKASLVHDDIQDNDHHRYGKQTVNAAHGVPIAINVGDILLGEGYRLLTQCNNMELLKVAAEAHISLCRGQGMELEWSRSPRSLTMDFVLDIFCNKTVPAFDVALIQGLISAGDDEQLRHTLHQYSRALGIAYQLVDDIEDYQTDEPLALRPSAVLAVLCEQYPGDFTESLLQGNEPKVFLNLPENKVKLQEAIDQVKQMAEEYQRAAFEALQNLTNIELKRLLFRVTKRILK